MATFFSQIGNADQTAIWFDMPELTTIELVGERPVQVRMPGVDKQRCTMMLAITADTSYHHFEFSEKKKNSPKRQISARNYCKSSRKRVDD
jgi:hypothetical protein